MIVWVVVVVTFFGLDVVVHERQSNAADTVHYLPSRPAWSSYDQANLKKNDHGCPTAIFVAPDGNLEQC